METPAEYPADMSDAKNPHVPPADASGPGEASRLPPAIGIRTVDLGGRRLIDQKPDDWLRFVTDRPDIHCLERLEGSLQWVGRETDVLLRVVDPEEGEFLVIIELQLRPDPRMAIRLEAYAALAEEKFGLQVFAVVVIILPGGAAETDVYESTVLGLSARREFRVIRMWEQDARQAAEVGASGLLPLVPVMRGGGDAELLAGALDRLRQTPELAGMDLLLAHFAMLVMGKEATLNLMRWDMETATGMTFYEEILSEGIAQGLARGVEQGLTQGAERGRQTARRMVQRVLEHRFGLDAAALATDLAPLDLDALERLLDVAEDAADLAVFRQALRVELG